MSNESTETIEKVKFTVPKMYNVVFHNDDTTPMDFVVLVLCDIFNYDHEAAYELMLSVHNKDAAIVGTFTKEIAETKQTKTKDAAFQHGFEEFTVTIELE